MTTPARRLALWTLSALGGVIGAWALFFPASFYDDFPGFGLLWISVDGPFNERLIRDVGAFYLALTAAGIAVALSRTLKGGRAMGIAWAVFSVPHLVYHLDHLHLADPVDAAVQAVALVLTLALTAPLLWPDARARTAPSTAPTTIRPSRRSSRPGSSTK